MSPWHDIKVPEDNLGGNVLLKIVSSKAGQIHVGLLTLCSAKSWIFPGVESSQLFQQANLLQCWTTYHSPEMTTTKVVHSSQKFSSCPPYRSPELRIQPTASSHRTQQDQIPGDWHLNTTTKQISQVGTKESVPVPAHPQSWWSWCSSRDCVCHTGRGALCLAATEKPFPTASSISRFLVVSNFLWPFLHSDQPPLSAESGKQLMDTITNWAEEKWGAAKGSGQTCLNYPYSQASHLPRIYGRI